MTHAAGARGDGATLRLDRGAPTPADLSLDGRPVSHHLGWPETLACLDRAMARMFGYFRAAQDRPDRAPDDLYLFEGGWVYAKRDGLAGPILWLFLLEQARALAALRPLAALEVSPSLTVPAEFLEGLRAELGLSTPDPALYPRHASPQLRDPRDRIGKWRFMWRSVWRVARTRPDPALRAVTGRCVLVSTASLRKHRYGTMIDDLRTALGTGTTILGVQPKERPWAADERYEDGVISVHRWGGVGTVLGAALRAMRLIRRHRRLQRDMARIDPVLASMLTYRYPHLFHALLHVACTRNAVAALRPAVFIRNGNYNTPDERRTNRACRAAGTPTVVVTPRSLSPRMPAMPMDFAREHDSLPDGFVVSDAHSVALLGDWHVPAERVSMGTLEILNDTPLPDTAEGRPCVLVLLDGPDNSVPMIEQVLAALPEGDFDLLVRTHPLVPLASMPAVAAALDGRAWTDVTGILMRDVVRPGRTLALSPCSGAGADAVRCGATLVWLPYLSSNAPAHADLLDTTGTVCPAPDALAALLRPLLDPQALRRAVEADRERLRGSVAPTTRTLAEGVLDQIRRLRPDFPLAPQEPSP